jgi:hypothetical protein
VPGKSPADALDEYVQPIRKSLQCLTPSKFAHVSPKAGIIQDLIIDEIGGAKLISALHINYRVSVLHKFVIQPSSRSYKVRTLAYRYNLDIETQDGTEEIVGYHWHPRGAHQFPHIHVAGADPSFHKVHLPTCRISLEDFLLCLIEDFGIPARTPNYRTILERNRRKFFEHCKWVWDWKKWY